MHGRLGFLFHAQASVVKRCMFHAAVGSGCIAWLRKNHVHSVVHENHVLMKTHEMGGLIVYRLIGSKPVGPVMG